MLSQYVHIEEDNKIRIKFKIDIQSQMQQIFFNAFSSNKIF